MGKRIYIAGPMTSQPLYNFPAFDAARDALAAQGHDPVSPADITRRMWKDRIGEDFDPAASHDGADYRTFLLADFAELATCEAVYLLPGWEKSKGVAAELAFAACLGLEVMNRTEPSPLAVASHVVNGDRQSHYGHPLDNHGNTAELWRSWVKRRFGVDVPFDAEAVCWLMILLKCSREANAPKHDNLVDVVGYAENVHMIRTERARRTGNAGQDSRPAVGLPTGAGALGCGRAVRPAEQEGQGDHAAAVSPGAEGA